MQCLLINTKNSYEVIIDSGLIHKLGAVLRQYRPICKVMIITDDTVSPLYLEASKEALLDEGYLVSTYSMPAGEKSKSLDTVSSIYEALITNQFTHSDIIIALGGGVVGDVSGFCASNYMRGIDLIQIPTTLLGAVDSSVGGKTAINMLNKKNIVGSFWQPLTVLCDYSTFTTLPDSEVTNGMAECLKYALLGGDQIVKHLQLGDYESLISECLRIKKAYVEADELDTGNRNFLNLGHTVAHALEALSDYSLPHGIAVAKGIMLEAKLSKALGYIGCDSVSVVKELLTSFGYDLSLPFSCKEIAGSITTDKKIANGRITLVVPHTIGHCTLETIPLDDYIHTLSEVE